jgi:hypothetical protein
MSYLLSWITSFPSSSSSAAAHYPTALPVCKRPRGIEVESLILKMEISVDEIPAEETKFDLSELRGAPPISGDVKEVKREEDDLDALAELVPGLRNRKHTAEGRNGMTLGEEQISPADVDKNGAAGDVVNKGKETRRMDTMNNQSGGENGNGQHKSPLSEGNSSSSSEGFEGKDVNEAIYGPGDEKEEVNSDRALSSDHSKPRPPDEINENLGLGEEFPNMSSNQSLSTATQTHEVRMPMYLPTFKPATGCTNASDFIVRCFVARLRSGITVVKHGRSRWCKSRLRILHIHPDGRSLSWKPAQGEPSSSRRPPKLDLTTCLEVRHAWSPDPQNPMYTGTPILRQKCEAANAHKSFALIFPKRTVDITSVTADQCKVLMEGFSALCFRLQVANLVGNGNKKAGQKMPEEEEVATTASGTLTNNSTNAKR